MAGLKQSVFSTQVGQVNDIMSRLWGVPSEEGDQNSLYAESSTQSLPTNTSTSNYRIAPPSKRVLDSGRFSPYQPNDKYGCLRCCKEMIGCANEEM